MRSIKSGVYKIINTATNKIYVGSSVDIIGRVNNHKRDLRQQKHHNIHLQNAWNKYGSDFFTYEVLEECPPIKTILLEREQHYLDTLKPEYNILPKAGSRLGSKQSDEAKEKVGAFSRGKTYEERYGVEKATELRKQRSEALKGKPLSEEHKAKCRTAALGHTPWNKGKNLSEETIEKIKEARVKQVMGPMTEEQKKKISEAHKTSGHKPSSRKGVESRLKGKTYEEFYGEEKAKELKEVRKEQGKKLQELTPYWEGKTMSEEHRRKIGEKSKGRVKSPETIELLRQKAKEAWERRKA